MFESIVLTVGNPMMGDDGAGPHLAELMHRKPLTDWQVMEGGTMPEDCLHLLREQRPQRVVVVDAADMGEPAGEIRLIEPQTIAQMCMVSTHSLPLNFLIDELKTFVPDVVMVGIQPAVVAFSFPMTDMVRQAVEIVYERLTDWQGEASFEHC
jgi:hydrogenase 3 maturation protease